MFVYVDFLCMMGRRWEGVVGISMSELVDGSREAAERRNKWGQEAKGGSVVGVGAVKRWLTSLGLCVIRN